MKQTSIFYYLFGSVIFILSQTALAGSIVEDIEQLELGESMIFCSDTNCTTYSALSKDKLKQTSVPLRQIIFESYSTQSNLCGNTEYTVNETKLFCDQTDNLRCVKISPGAQNECLFEEFLGTKDTGLKISSRVEKQASEYTQIVLSDNPEGREVFCNSNSCVELFIRKEISLPHTKKFVEVEEVVREPVGVADGVNGYEPILPYISDVASDVVQ